LFLTWFVSMLTRSAWSRWRRLVPVAQRRGGDPLLWFVLGTRNQTNEMQSWNVYATESCWFAISSKQTDDNGLIFFLSLTMIYLEI
jgi:hypothetical protein